MRFLVLQGSTALSAQPTRLSVLLGNILAYHNNNHALIAKLGTLASTCHQLWWLLAVVTSSTLPKWPLLLPALLANTRRLQVLTLLARPATQATFAMIGRFKAHLPLPTSVQAGTIALQARTTTCRTCASQDTTVLLALLLWCLAILENTVLPMDSQQFPELVNRAISASQRLPSPTQTMEASPASSAQWDITVLLAPALPAMLAAQSSKFLAPSAPITTRLEPQTLASA